MVDLAALHSYIDHADCGHYSPSDLYTKTLSRVGSQDAKILLKQYVVSDPKCISKQSKWQ